MSYDLFAKLATEVFGDAKMEAYYQTWKLSKTPAIGLSWNVPSTSKCVVEQAREDLMNVCFTNSIAGGACSLARSDTYADHEYGGGSKDKCSLARSDTYADHEYGGGAKGEFSGSSGPTLNSLAKSAFTPAHSSSPLTPFAPKKSKDGSNAKPSEDDDRMDIVKELNFKSP